MFENKIQFCITAYLLYKCIFFRSQSDTEFSDLYLRRISNENYTSAKLFDASVYGGDLPESIDWRSKGAVSSIKNQV